MFHLFQFFQMYVAKYPMPFFSLTPWRYLFFTNFAAVRENISARATGMKAASAGWVEGAGYVTDEAKIFLLYVRIRDRDCRKQLFYSDI